MGSLGAAATLLGMNSPAASSNEGRPSSWEDLGDENHAPGKKRDEAVDSYRDLEESTDDEGSTGCSVLSVGLVEKLSDNVT